MANDYLEGLMAELAKDGIRPPESSLKHTNGMDDKEKKVIDEMESITGKSYSDEQRKILEHHGNACILACAGSGKTTVSTHLIAKRIKTGEIVDVNKLVYTTYSKAGATEMKERLDALLKQLGMSHIAQYVQVRTLHSFFLQIIRLFGINSKIISESDRLKYVRQACKDAEFPLKDDDLMLVSNLLSYQVNNLLSDNKTLLSYVNTLENLEQTTYSKIRQGYANQKAVAGVIDYDDMQTYLYLWLVKYAKSDKEDYKAIAKSVRDYCKAMWTDFYIDEAQDVSKIQFEIIRAMVTNESDSSKLDRHLVFIGDDDQCIYQWRGGDPSIILSIGPLFDIKTFVLSTNYRCYNEIVDYAATGIKYNSSRYQKGMNAFMNGGSVKILPSSKQDLCSLSNLAVAQIKKWMENGDRLSDIAVLSRNNFHLAILSNMLMREGIYCNMTEDMKLTKSYMYKDIKNIIDISETSWKSQLTRETLWRLCRYMGMSTSSIIADFQNSGALSLEDTLGWLIKHYIDKDLDFDKKLKINLQAEEKMKYHINRLASDTIEDLEKVYHALTCGDRQRGLTSLLFQYLEASKFLYKSKDKSRSIRGLVSYIIQMMTSDGIQTMLDFLRITEQLEGGYMVVPGEKLTLTTIHSAKGREWKNVIMFACDNISQPSIDGIYSMIEDGVSINDIYSNIDEERRLFYVGNTRAKENLLVLTYGQPSIFILEALGLFGKKTGGNNDSVIELVNNPDTWILQHKEFIDKHIHNKDSKYFCDLELEEQ